MYSFDDSVHPNAPGTRPALSGGSATPIFDKLMEEWQRMFRAVPGDRYGEGYQSASTGMQAAYGPASFGVSGPLSVPAFQPGPGAYGVPYGPSGYGASGGYNTPPQPASQGASPQQQPAYDQYGRQSDGRGPSAGRSGLALMPVAGYQANQAPHAQAQASGTPGGQQMQHMPL
ncbi:hypothetical protein [Yinghuangia seranimata]|uniref:hypothetical protein n=1 Tax=Yinghuangia seranimata TaxID=408067 RepID=UPI00248C4F4D|nr:hypothetical protein [Yinghuangia seranimata]MDI2131809.1 hypothetical protein [Yinghuangia seranimata]